MLLTRDKWFYRNMILLAIPMVLQNLITFSVGLADNLMIGSLGDSAVSGVYMGSQIQTVLQVISAGIEGGILLLSSQYWGKYDRESIRRIITIGFYSSLLLGTVFTVVCALFPRGVISIFTKEPDVIAVGSEYLKITCYTFIFFCITQALISAMRSVESPKIGLIVSTCSLVCNIVLNYILIFGKFGFPMLGVKGAAIATLVSRIVETAIILIYVVFIDKKLQISIGMMKTIDKGLLRDFVKYDFPIVAGQLVWGTNLFVRSVILGHFTESVITALSLANTVNNMMYVCMNGLSAAVGIIIGKTVGSGNISKIKEYSVTVQVLFLGLGLLTGGFFAIICDPFIGLYNISEEAVFYSRQLIHVLCFTSIGTCYECGCLFGLVKSGGDVSFVFKNDTCFVFLVVIPSALIAYFCSAPAWVVFLCLFSDQILKCVSGFFKIRKYDWMKNLTKGNNAGKSFEEEVSN